MAAPSALRAAAREAWLYGLPLIEIARLRAASRSADSQPQVNHIALRTQLSGPEARTVTTPNNDTIYASANLDLSRGGATLILPKSGKRYVSVQLMDAFTNTFAILGTRTTGGDGGRFQIVGPGGSAPPGAIRSPTPWVWMIVRILADGPEDLAAAGQIQAELKLEAPVVVAPTPFALRDAPWPAYFTSVQALLRENPPPATDGAFFERVRPLGLMPSRGFDAARFSASEAAEIEAGVADARALIGARRPLHNEGGWTYPPANLGVYGQDYLTRAAVALTGLGALTREEAMYMRAVAPNGGPIFDSDQAWRLTFPAERLPPVDAFWSLSMYEATSEGQLYFTRNPINRYSIGDRTRGLQRNADGSLDLWISRADPGEARRANWLPAPASGPYAMHLRAYLPRPELLNGAYHLPALVPA